MNACLQAMKHESDKTFFTKNGGLLLEELIAFCDGRSNPIRHFSKEVLLRATNNYDECNVFRNEMGYQMYKGSLEDRPIIVKKYENPVGDPYKDIAVGSLMSAHKNVLKVLGCCLETRKPYIVNEFVGTKLLSTCISATNVEPLPWKCRLRIAMDLANAIAYLHITFSRPVIHRDIKPRNVILDENNIPKLMGFGLCISIPAGESRVKDEVRGTEGYIAPEYYKTGFVTEKADVYSFGILLFELSSGEEAYDDLLAKRDSIMEHEEPFDEEVGNIVHGRLTNEGIEQEQLMDFKAILLRCISTDEVQRPTMIEVAKELRRIYQSFQAR